MNHEQATFASVIGHAIRERRNQREMSLDRLGQEAGLNVSRTTIANIELGKQQVSAFQLFCISQVLGFSLDEIVAEYRRQFDITLEVPADLRDTIANL